MHPDARVRFQDEFGRIVKDLEKGHADLASLYSASVVSGFSKQQLDFK